MTVESVMQKKRE